MSDQAVVEEYLRTFAAFDWEGFAAILADENLRRVGPFMDVIETKEDYVDFLSKLMPTLINYEVPRRSRFGLRVEALPGGTERDLRRRRGPDGVPPG